MAGCSDLEAPSFFTGKPPAIQWLSFRIEQVVELTGGWASLREGLIVRNWISAGPVEFGVYGDHASKDASCFAQDLLRLAVAEGMCLGLLKLRVTVPPRFGRHISRTGFNHKKSTQDLLHGWNGML
jgi:hypothetical protein